MKGIVVEIIEALTSPRETSHRLMGETGIYYHHNSISKRGIYEAS
jgi:hypothetical protein